MARIEIWKAKSAWRTMPLGERRAMIHHLSALVERNLQDHAPEDSGPYLVPKGGSDLLVWATEANEAEVMAQYVGIGLDAYFEPLAYATVTDKLNARVLARKLSA